MYYHFKIDTFESAGKSSQGKLIDKRRAYHSTPIAVEQEDI